MTDLFNRNLLHAFFGETHRASTLVEVGRFAISAAKIEVEAVAVLPS